MISPANATPCPNTSVPSTEVSNPYSLWAADPVPYSTWLVEASLVSQAMKVLSSPTPTASTLEMSGAVVSTVKVSLA